MLLSRLDKCFFCFNSFSHFVDLKHLIQALLWAYTCDLHRCIRLQPIIAKKKKKGKNLIDITFHIFIQLRVQH